MIGREQIYLIDSGDGGGIGIGIGGGGGCGGYGKVPGDT